MRQPPLAERIRVGIETRILSGEWPPGYRVPAESELMEQHNCARMTVNKALSALAAAGLVERRRRAGTFVARPRSQSMVLEIADLAALVTARGQTYGWKLLRQRTVNASALQAAAPVLEIEGIHYADHMPLAHEHRLIAIAEVPEVATADFSHQAPGTWLLSHAPWTEAENRISAKSADRAMARVLGVPVHGACLVVTRRTWRGAAPVTLVIQTFAPDRHELVARFGPASG